MLVRLLLGLTLLLTLGCGSGYQFAPVSGTVTLDGQPLANALVSVQPIAPEGEPETGPSSVGKTDETGFYTLKAATGKKGAVVGKHLVRINVLLTQTGSGDERRPAGVPPPTLLIPRRYNVDTELKLEVPPGGIENADFELKSD